MVLLIHIFIAERSMEGLIQIVLYSFCRSCQALLHLAVKILSNLLHEDLSTLALHTSVGCISLQNASRTALLLPQPILLSENIPNI